MPAVVAEYIKNRDIKLITEIQSNIINAYILDMVKYANNSESVKIRTAFESIPAQLAKNNKKFQYKLLKKGASASHFGVAIDWLCASGIVKKCSRIEHGLIPLNLYVDLSAFKLYMSDTGLLSNKAGITLQILMLSDQRQSIFKGALTENYASQSLISNGYELYYWESPSIAEIDFVLNIDGNAIPVEVKTSEYVKSRSLDVFIKKYKPSYAMRISSKNFGFENNIKSIPLYSVFAV